MKKIILIYVFMLCFCVIVKANAQTVYKHSNTICDRKNDNIPYCTTTEGTPISGIYKEYYESGALQAELNFKNGKQNGITKAYYESGALKSEKNFKDGKQIGITKWYYESGALKSEENWKNGKQNGIRKDYYESGALQAEGNWKDDKQNGITKWYYESGALKLEDNFKDGKLDGISKEYYESGALKSESNWKDDKKDGLTKKYDESGILLDANEFKNPAICIGAALQTLVCAANSAFSYQASKEITDEFTDCFNSEYPGVSTNDFLEYYDEGKNMVLRATNHCNYISPAVDVVSNYCRNMYKLDKCLYRSSVGNYTGADTVSGIVYTLINRWR